MDEIEALRSQIADTVDVKHAGNAQEIFECVNQIPGMIARIEGQKVLFYSDKSPYLTGGICTDPDCICSGIWFHR